MKFIRSYYILIAVLLFALFTIAAHLLAPVDYSFSRDAISALGAQGYDKKIIMQLGFLSFAVVLSAGMIINGVRWVTLPILIFGVSMAMTGIFCAKPFHEAPGSIYSHSEASIHSIFSQIAAISFWCGILLQMLFSTDSKLKIIHLSFLAVLAGIGLCLRFMLFKNDAGAAQRVLFLISFIWLTLTPARSGNAGRFS